MKKFLFCIVLLFLASDVMAECQYFAYISYGPAMFNGHLDKHENAYKSSNIFKNIGGFKAVFTSFNQTSLAGGFKIENIGPYDTEMVAYTALENFLDHLKSEGFVKKSSKHTFPAIILRNKKKCD